MIATIVHTDELLKTIAAAAAGGIGVTFVFAVGIWGASQFSELSREGRTVAATAAAGVAALALFCVLAAVVIALVVMTHN